MSAKNLNLSKLQRNVLNALIPSWRLRKYSFFLFLMHGMIYTNSNFPLQYACFRYSFITVNMHRYVLFNRTEIYNKLKEGRIQNARQNSPMMHCQRRYSQTFSPTWEWWIGNKISIFVLIREPSRYIEDMSLQSNVLVLTISY